MSSGAKRNYVGQFFENVGHELLGGEIVRNDDGDICIGRMEVSIEVKASGAQSSYGFRLEVGQIDHYEHINGFPFDVVRYLFFSYRNLRTTDPETGKRPTELSHHKSSIAINRYLASAVEWCVALDLSIVSRWKETRPHSTKSVPGHPGRETVDIKPAEVHALGNGGFAKGILGLGLNPSDFRRLSTIARLRVKPDLFEEYVVEFPLTVIVPVEQVRLVKSSFRERQLPLKADKMASKPLVA